MNRRYFTLAELFYLSLAIGWCMNVYKLIVHCDFAAPWKDEIIRAVGIFLPPLGGILGFFTF